MLTAKSEQKNTVTAKGTYTRGKAHKFTKQIVDIKNTVMSFVCFFCGHCFKFFDSHGNFTGEHLKVVEELNAKINFRYVDGRTLEADLSDAPWGYSFGTIVATLSTLLRAGRL